MESENQEASQSIEIFCDGACVPNPGHMGCGVVVGDEDYTVSQYCGEGTNQLAELLALKIALKFATPSDQIYSDSQYALNVAMGTWQARVHLNLIQEIKVLLETKRVDLHWVRGHDGHELQELADVLAKRAARTRRSLIDPSADLLSRRSMGGLGRDQSEIQRS